MRLLGYCLLTSTGFLDSDLIFPSEEAARKYLSLKDTYFFKTNSQIVPVYCSIRETAPAGAEIATPRSPPKPE